MGGIADTIAPLRHGIGPETYAKLAAALTLLLGIDPVVVLTDIAGISREQALEVLDWSARALVEGAVRESAARRPRHNGKGKNRQ